MTSALSSDTEPNSCSPAGLDFFSLFDAIQGTLMNVVDAKEAIGPNTVDLAGNLIQLRWISW